MSWEPDYITPTELKDYVRNVESDDDAEVAMAITGASRAIDLHCNRQFGVDTAPTTRLYRSKLVSPSCRRVKVDDIMTIDGLLVQTNEDTPRTLSYTLAPVNNLVKGKPYTEIRLYSYVPPVGWEDVMVTATFGWTSVPVPVKQACAIQANRFLARREAPFGIAGSPDQGSEMRLLARVDPDVGVNLMKYVRWWA